MQAAVCFPPLHLLQTWNIIQINSHESPRLTQYPPTLEHSSCCTNRLTITSEWAPRSCCEPTSTHTHICAATQWRNLGQSCWFSDWHIRLGDPVPTIKLSLALISSGRWCVRGLSSHCVSGDEDSLCLWNHHCVCVCVCVSDLQSPASWRSHSPRSSAVVHFWSAVFWCCPASSACSQCACEGRSRPHTHVTLTDYAH